MSPVCDERRVRRRTDCETASRWTGNHFLPSQTWFSTHFQRPQQLARALAAAAHRSFIASPGQHSRSRQFGRVTSGRFPVSGILVERLHLLALAEVGPARSTDRRCAGRIADDLAVAGGSFPEDPTSLVVYEIIDYHELIPDANEKWKQQHHDWVNKADVLVASADDLVAELRPHRPDTLLLPNAVTLEDWQNFGSGGSCRPTWRRRGGRSG